MNKLFLRFLIGILSIVLFIGADDVYAEFHQGATLNIHHSLNHFNVSNEGSLGVRSTQPSNSIQNQDDKKQTFVINNCITDLNEFKKLVQSASRLKKYGDVQINIGVVADKAFYEIPEGGNPWSEYASNFANLYKFYPDKKIAPFIPEKFVRDNVQLLLAKVKILRENGMDAAFFSNEPEIIPSAFFEAYPELRGPRVDHPRRSNVAFFSPCLSMKEMQGMYAGMMAELLKNTPEIKTFFFKTNDAGSGNCWSDWLYPGPNGPDHCKNETTGQRIENIFNALQEGALKAGTKLDVYLSHAQGSSNFSDEERIDIQNHLPANCFFASTSEHEMKSIGNDFAFLYPVKGILDVYSFLSDLKGIDRQKPQTIFMSLGAFYSRGNESPIVDDLMLKLLDDYFSNPSSDLTAKQKLQAYCRDWAEGNHADSLCNAFLDLSAADMFRNSYLGNLYGIYWNVSNRMITRPLVVAPQRLTKEEEAYSLPHIFNVSENEARMDYLDINGGRWTASRDSIQIYVGKIMQICKKLEDLGNGTKNEFVTNLDIALRIHASLFRSIGNFTVAQQIRDRNAGKLNSPIHRPSKESTWTGDPDLLKFNEIMRDELDNTSELIGVLEKNGTNELCLAKDAAHEDCFILGPDIMQQLNMKYKIMISHWRDIEDYMTTPFK